jgi:glycosyltransferase involved in cell wall biosynthesis
MAEDPWMGEPAFFFKSKWWNYLKDNFFFFITIDSLPIINIAKEWAENCKNIAFWTSFGVKALHNENIEKYGHVQHIFGAIDAKEYFPLDDEIVKQTRRRFNIDDDIVLFTTISRNQLRKLYIQQLEGFSIFKKNNPQYKAKLHFHCSFSEGWPIDKMRQDFGIAKEDVLVTYFCKNCKDWVVQPFYGEDLNCDNCKAEKSRITAGVTSTLSNSDINLIHNMSDAYVAAYTSGGQELGICQNLLVGKPLLSTNYSCGEDYCSQDFVFSLNGTYTYEVGTGFKKHVPDVNQIANFYKTICEMPKSKKEEIKQKSIKWAKENLDIDIVGPKFEKWIDSRKKVEWNYEYPPEKPKNPSFPLPEIPDPSLFIKTLYKEMLNVDVKEDDQGYKDWMAAMANGRSRQDIHKFFAGVAAGDNSKIQQTVSLKDVLIQNGKKQVLMVAQQSFGDLFMISALFESLRKMYPSETHNLYIACDPQYKEILEGNPYIDMILNFIPEMDNEILMTGQGNNDGIFDEYLHATASTQKFLNYVSRTKIDLNNKE